MTLELLIQELLVRKPCWGLRITSEQHLQSIQHTSAHFFCSTIQFVCYLSVLNCNLKVSDGNCILLSLFKRYCALLEVNIIPEKLQYHTTIGKRKQENAKVSHQLVYTRISHQCCQPGYMEKPLQSPVSNSVFSWVSPQNNTHVL